MTNSMTAVAADKIIDMGKLIEADKIDLSIFGFSGSWELTPGTLILNGVAAAAAPMLTPPTRKPSTTDHEAVRAQVNRLGVLGSAEAIAEFFRREDVKGLPGSSRECIIARWLSDTCGPVDVYGIVNDRHTGEFITQLPVAARAFTHYFDYGLYPDLTTLTTTSR